MVEELQVKYSSADVLKATNSVSELQEQGKVVRVRVLTKADRELIWDLYIRGVRVSEIARIKGLKESTVNKVLKSWVRNLKKRLEAIKKNPEEELIFLSETFDNISRLAFQQFAAQKSGVVKERFLSTALKAILCRLKLLSDAGFLNINLSEIFDKDGKVQEDIPQATKEKLREILENIKKNKIIDVKAQ